MRYLGLASYYLHLQLLSFRSQYLLYFFYQVTVQKVRSPSFLKHGGTGSIFKFIFPGISSCSVERAFAILWRKLLNCWSSSKTISINCKFSFGFFRDCFLIFRRSFDWIFDFVLDKRGSEFLSYKIKLRNRFTQNDVTRRVTNSKISIEILLSSD